MTWADNRGFLNKPADPVQAGPRRRAPTVYNGVLSGDDLWYAPTFTNQQVALSYMSAVAEALETIAGDVEDIVQDISGWKTDSEDADPASSSDAAV